MNISTSFDDIEKKICMELDSLVNDATENNYKDTEWTSSLKARLSNLGLNLGYEVRPSSTHSEFLYDLVWLKVEDGIILDVPLILESEWKQGEEEYDFDKLLLSRASHKIMVFTARQYEGEGGSTSKLLSRLKKFNLSSSGDRYLFAAWNNGKWSFEYKLYIV